MTMQELTYKVTFTTPAFLGNAEQSAQWRTPPFKALLRQWWRVVYAPTLTPPFDVNALRKAEADLFGTASDEGEAKSHRSRVRLRLSKWEYGTVNEWHADNPISHPETDVPKIGAELYLGFGPLTRGDTGKRTKEGKPIKDTILSAIKDSAENAKRTAIDDKTKADLRLILPEIYSDDIQTTMQLAAWFGTLGSRSRNGWGSLQLEHDHFKSLTRATLASLGVTRSLSDCLREEWPHAIGCDDKGRPLVWRTKITGDWRVVIRELARIKIAFRTQPVLSLNGVPTGRFAPRHLLAYPVTHHPVNGNGWGGQGRLANQIRFKFSKTANGQIQGTIVHLPCALPQEMADSIEHEARHDKQIETWKAVHTILDNEARRLD